MNGEEARVFRCAEGGGDPGTIAGEVAGGESGEECVADERVVEPAAEERAACSVGFGSDGENGEFEAWRRGTGAVDGGAGR